MIQTQRNIQAFQNWGTLPQINKSEFSGKIFNHIGNYRKHMRIHEGYRPFECNVCGKKFGQSSNYKNHMKVHLNDRPYKCDFPQCHRSFVQPNNLILHQRVHSGEKPFSCEVFTCISLFYKNHLFHFISPSTPF